MGMAQNPATPGQIEYGRRMEARYGVESIFDWTKVTRTQARERNGMLRSLNDAIRTQEDTVLRDFSGYLTWVRDPNQPSQFDTLR